MAMCGLLGAAILAGCGGPAERSRDLPGEELAAATQSTVAEGGSPAAAPTGPAEASGPIFRDVAAATSIDFRHESGLNGSFYFPEVNGGGVAFLDYDSDGDLDIYFVDGGPLEPLDAPGLPGRLYRSLLVDTGELRFEDVTAGAGFERVAYGQGVAVADFDNDGHVDIYQANFGANQLFRNNGDGTFTNVAAAAGVDDDRWSSGASFFDYDRDGWLDLFVVNYVRYTLATNKICPGPSGVKDYCGPMSYLPVPDRLYRNNGDGSFSDVTAALGIAAAEGPGLGVVVADFDGDGWPDVLVANDGMDNHLWMNRAGQRFENTALMAGVAYNAAGAAEAGMGVVAEDLDEDLDWDLVLAHLSSEHTTLYLNLGGAIFEDRSVASGVAGPTRPYTGFGLGSLDYDGDGTVDLAIAHGAVRLEGMEIAQIPQADGDLLTPYRQPHMLLRNLGPARFEDVTARAGAGFTTPDVGRGLAVGDVDNDGAPDLVIAHIQDVPRLLINQLGAPGGGWLGLDLRHADGRRHALGAEVTVTLADGRQLLRRAHTDGSQVSARDPRVLVGLDGQLINEVAVRWPDGSREAWPWADQPLNRYVRVLQTAGPVQP